MNDEDDEDDDDGADEDDGEGEDEDDSETDNDKDDDGGGGGGEDMRLKPAIYQMCMTPTYYASNVMTGVCINGAAGGVWTPTSYASKGCDWRRMETYLLCFKCVRQ